MKKRLVLVLFVLLTYSVYKFGGVEMWATEFPGNSDGAEDNTVLQVYIGRCPFCGTNNFLIHTEEWTASIPPYFRKAIYNCINGHYFEVIEKDGMRVVLPPSLAQDVKRVKDFLLASPTPVPTNTPIPEMVIDGWEGSIIVISMKRYDELIEAQEQVITLKKRVEELEKQLSDIEGIQELIEIVRLMNEPGYDGN
jgi:hypothetical protein